jgi:hypothetical protein
MPTQAGTHDARLQSLAEHQSKVLARLVQLRQLEALLQHLAATGTAAAQLPDLCRPLAGALVPGGVAAAAAAAGGSDAQGKGAAAPK